MRGAVSDDSDSDEGHRREVGEEVYCSASGIGAALRSPDNYVAAVEELAEFIDRLYPACSKGAQARVGADAHAALSLCDGRQACRGALASLARAVERRLPQARRAAFTREYKQRGVQLHRRGRRSGVGGGGGAAGGSDSEEPAGAGDLPPEVLSSVLRCLGPLSLAAAACVSTGWRAAAGDERLWEPLLLPTFSARPEAQGQPPGSFRELFAQLAARFPADLLPWRTNRALLGGRLVWLPPLQPRGSRAGKALTPPQAVETLWRRSQGAAGPRALSGRDSGSSDSDDEALASRARFWNIRDQQHR